MDAKISQLMGQAKDIPEYKQMMDYLMARRAVPEMISTKLPPGVKGEFSYDLWPGGDLQPRGRITTDYSAGVDTLLHEVQHAARRQMEQQYRENSDRFGLFGNSKATPFQEAYEKLQYNRYGRTRDQADPITSLMKKISPDFVESDPGYRSSPSEAQAFGMGSAATGVRSITPAPDHIDTTLASEFLILLDLAMKDQAKKPASQGR